MLAHFADQLLSKSVVFLPSLNTESRFASDETDEHLLVVVSDLAEGFLSRVHVQTC